MKRIHLLAVLLATFVTVPLFAVGSRTNIVDDVIRMQKAGVAEQTILDFVHKGDSSFDVSADDMIALHDAGVPRNVIAAVLDEANARGDRRDRDYASRDGYRDGRTVIVSPPVYSYGGWPYYYDPYYYDPYWYGPRVSIGFGFGFGRYYGGYHGPIFRHHGRR